MENFIHTMKSINVLVTNQKQLHEKWKILTTKTKKRKSIQYSPFSIQLFVYIQKAQKLLHRQGHPYIHTYHPTTNNNNFRTFPIQNFLVVVTKFTPYTIPLINILLFLTKFYHEMMKLSSNYTLLIYILIFHSYYFFVNLLLYTLIDPILIPTEKSSFSFVSFEKARR